MKNAMKEIIDIENRAREILQAAEEQVRAIETQAKEDVDRIAKEARAESERDIQRRLESSKEQIERHRAEAADRWRAELDRLQKRFASAEAEAVARVIRRIIGGSEPVSW